MIDTPTDAETLARLLQPLSLEARLAEVSRLPGRKVFTTSLGIEDQVITDAIARAQAAIEIATLETGRLFPETLSLIAETQKRYDLAIASFRPVETDVSAYAAKYGMNGFYESIEARKACCDVRKMRPLAKALDGASVWITGIRRGQSGARAQTPLAEWDAERGFMKVNPLADLDLASIRTYAALNDVPLNPLHDRGFPSIGCEPCTRAIKPGESERAGRWWWEQDTARECGLHVKTGTLSVPELENTRAMPS